MERYTTTEADPSAAAAYLRALKHKNDPPPERAYHPEETPDWFTRSREEVKEKLGRESLWDTSSALARGWDYERLAEVNIGGNHPVIDAVHAYDGIVTSMKTMDTHLPGYSVPAAIKWAERGYVNAFEHFTGVSTSDGFVLPLDQIRGRHLEIAVPMDINQDQRDALYGVQQYGADNGVRVIIAEVP